MNCTKLFFNDYISGILLLLLTLSLVVVLPLYMGISSVLIIVLFLGVLYFKQYSIFPWSKYIENCYNKQFFGDAVLSDIPHSPKLAINATDVATGTLFTFSQERSICYAYDYNKEEEPTHFDCSNFPVARAVMASSCVPHLFSPIRIEAEFQTGNKRNDILLVDGGLYDNQGAHKLIQPKSGFKTQYCIVSDAGNKDLSARGALNSANMILKSVDILMRRIRTFQSSQNMFTQMHEDSRFAYIALRWKFEPNFIERFVSNVKCGNVYEDIIDAHGITEEELSALRSQNKEESQQAFKAIQTKVEQSIGWHNLIQRCPSDDTHKLALSVGTNLVSISKEKINALIAHAEWLSEVQLRTYLPFLIQNL